MTKKQGVPAVSLKWDDAFDATTVQLAYEQARETQRVVEQTADVLDRKVVAVFGISSAIATFAPIVTKVAPGSVSACLSLGAGVAWTISAFRSWQAFRPLTFLTDPNPRQLISPTWLTLKPGPYYLGRLHRVAERVEANNALLVARGTALTGAFRFALIEVFLFLVALALQGQ